MTRRVKRCVVERLNQADGATLYGYRFDCPGCDSAHVIKVGDGGWAFNGDEEKPTFSPSILCNRDLSNPTRPRCHSFVRDGRIQFLKDCTHALAGQTVELPEV